MLVSEVVSVVVLVTVTRVDGGGTVVIATTVDAGIGVEEEGPELEIVVTSTAIEVETGAVEDLMMFTSSSRSDVTPDRFSFSQSWTTSAQKDDVGSSVDA